MSQLRRRSLRPTQRRAHVPYDGPHAHLWVDTDDGVRIAGTRIGSNDKVAVVMAHGFLGWRTKPKWRAMADALARRFTVLTFDLRGHGASGGLCSGGEHEYLDVHAVASHARARGFERVATVGSSLGAIAVLVEAATFRDVDAVVSISSPALWGASDLKAAKRATWLMSHPVGRAIAQNIFGTEIGGVWGDPPPPADLVAKIAPVPLWLVHGDDDHFFPPADAELLYARAGEPKRLSILPGFGHAEDGFTPAFARTLADGIEAMLV